MLRPVLIVSSDPKTCAAFHSEFQNHGNTSRSFATPAEAITELILAVAAAKTGATRLPKCILVEYSAAEKGGLKNLLFNANVHQVSVFCFGEQLAEMELKTVLGQGAATYFPAPIDVKKVVKDIARILQEVALCNRTPGIGLKSRNGSGGNASTHSYPQS
jgi:hypothetical protein